MLQTDELMLVTVADCWRLRLIPGCQGDDNRAVMLTHSGCRGPLSLIIISHMFINVLVSSQEGFARSLTLTRTCVSGFCANTR